MLLTSLRDYIQLKGRVDLQNIARHFCLPESAITQMLSFWVHKGIIKCITVDNAGICHQKKCSSCSDCHIVSTIIYTWL